MAPSVARLAVRGEWPPFSRWRMQTARDRNSAVERATAAQVDPLAAADAAATRRIPGLPEQCDRCLRWVDRARLAVRPIGAAPWCSLCSAIEELQEAVKNSRLSLAKEEEVLESIFRAHELLRGR